MPKLLFLQSRSMRGAYEALETKMGRNMYLFLADVILSTHVAFVLFVLAGLLLTVLGGMCHWAWVRNIWFRGAHLIGIAVVTAQAWAGVICPLTILEMWLRRKGQGDSYEGSFIQHWLQHILYYDAPEWVFTTAYTSFGLLVAITWIFLPPKRKRASDISMESDA